MLRILKFGVAFLSDFLNPVSKEVVAEECGLIGEGYLVTDLNPTTLGLNMVEPETISPDHLFGEELSFQFYELTSPSQLQSAWHLTDNGKKIRVIFLDESTIQDVQIVDTTPRIEIADNQNTKPITNGERWSDSEQRAIVGLYYNITL